MLLLFVAVCLHGCANRGIGPQGGVRDTIPPKIIREVPLNGTLNYKDPKIELHFDEYLQLDNVADNVLISPPQRSMPEVKAIGKHISVHFLDSLQDSTTYTIDFGNAICDYHEKNPISNYAFSFATGNSIDSLEIYGQLINAEDLNPVSGIIVGIHKNLEDSALQTMPFSRITRSDSTGMFVIRNIREGSYRLYALQDISRDYIYQPGEALAMYDSIITPYIDYSFESDTLWRDSIVVDSLRWADSLIIDTLRLIDSIQITEYLNFEPSELVLWYFNENKQRHYFQRVLREQQHMFTLYFSAAQDSVPIIRSLAPYEVDSTKTDTVWTDWMQYVKLQTNRTNDTICYWLTDSLVIGQDSLWMELTYLKSDSLYNLQQQVDTVLAVWREPRMSAKAKAAKHKRDMERKLDIRTNASSSFNVYDTLRLSFSVPIDSVYLDSLRFYEKVDTVRRLLPFVLNAVDSGHMVYQVLTRMQPEHMYELEIDSAAFRDIYGAVNNDMSVKLKLKSVEEYSTLTIRMEPYEPNLVLQLLDEKEKVVRTMKAQAEGTKFVYLDPKVYYLRMFVDQDGDGRWTTGDLIRKRQPERVFYFPHKMTLRANWDFEETFNYLAVPQIDSKPRELIKPISTKKK